MSEPAACDEDPLVTSAEPGRYDPCSEERTGGFVWKNGHLSDLWQGLTRLSLQRVASVATIRRYPFPFAFFRLHGAQHNQLCNLILNRLSLFSVLCRNQ